MTEADNKAKAVSASKPGVAPAGKAVAKEAAPDGKVASINNKVAGQAEAKPQGSEAWTAVSRLYDYIRARIIGQEKLVNRLLLAILSDGHILVEGPPGLAKTRSIQALASGIEADFHRVQFTPDLLPADLTGTDIYRPQTADFIFQKGPLFHNLILADEINRAPAKVQSALLEAMAERQITVGGNTYRLPDLFLVMATQNPIEQEGTYPLPEAQLDRFLMHVQVDYPETEQELEILRLARNEATARENREVDTPGRLLGADIIHAARREVLSIFMAESLESYITHLVMATRQPQKYDGELKNWIQYGCSPRATITLDRCARAHAWLAGNDFVSPDDVQAVAADVMRHRLVLGFAAEADGVGRDEVVHEVIRQVAIP